MNTPTKPPRARRSYALVIENDTFLRKESLRLQRSVNSLINRLIEKARKSKGGIKW